VNIPPITIPNFRAKCSKSIPVFRPKRLKNHTLWGGTYLYTLYKGVPHPRGSSHISSNSICYVAIFFRGPPLLKIPLNTCTSRKWPYLRQNGEFELFVNFLITLHQASASRAVLCPIDPQSKIERDNIILNVRI